MALLLAALLRAALLIVADGDTVLGMVDIGREDILEIVEDMTEDAGDIGLTDEDIWGEIQLELEPEPPPGVYQLFLAELSVL